MALVRGYRAALISETCFGHKRSKISAPLVTCGDVSSTLRCRFFVSLFEIYNINLASCSMCVCCHPDNVWKWESLTKFKWHWVFPNSCLFPVWAFMILVKAVTFPDTSRWLPSLHHIFPLVDNCCSSDSIASVFNAKEHGGFTKRLPLTTCHLPCRNHQAGSFWNPDSFDEWRQRSSSTDNPVPASGVCLLQRLHWCQAGFSNCGEATAAQHQQFGVGWCEWFSGQAPMSTSLTL